MMATVKKDVRNMAELRLKGSNVKPDKEKSKLISNWMTGITNTINHDRRDRRKNTLFAFRTFGWVESKET